MALFNMSKRNNLCKSVSHDSKGLRDMIIEDQETRQKGLLADTERLVSIIPDAPQFPLEEFTKELFNMFTTLRQNVRDSVRSEVTVPSIFVLQRHFWTFLFLENWISKMDKYHAKFKDISLWNYNKQENAEESKLIVQKLFCDKLTFICRHIEQKWNEFDGTIPLSVEPSCLSINRYENFKLNFDLSNINKDQKREEEERQKRVEETKRDDNRPLKKIRLITCTICKDDLVDNLICPNGHGACSNCLNSPSFKAMKLCPICRSMRSAPISLKCVVTDE